jgi:hypothetical protein
MTTPLRHADIDDAIPASGAQLASRSKANALLKRIAFHAAAAPAAVERSVQERLGDVVSIKDFGARGDGTTDDTPAFRNALGRAGARLLVPQGTYDLSSMSSAIDVADGVDLIGAGARRTKIIGASGVNLFSVPNSMRIEGLRVESAQRVIHAAASEVAGSIELVDCEFDDGLICMEIGSRPLDELRVLRCAISNYTSAAISGAYGPSNRYQRLHVEGCRFKDNVRYCIRGSAHAARVLHNHFEGLTEGTFTGSAGVARCIMVSTSDMIVVSNLFKNITSTENNSNAIYYAGRSLVFAFNICIDFRGGGEVVDSKNEVADSWQIIGNHFEMTYADVDLPKKAAITFQALGAVIAHNTFTSWCGDGIRLGTVRYQNVVIDGNRFINHRSTTAIRLTHALSTVEEPSFNVKITNNVASRIRNVVNETLDGSSLARMIAVNNVQPGSRGIWISGNMAADIRKSDDDQVSNYDVGALVLVTSSIADTPLTDLIIRENYTKNVKYILRSRGTQNFGRAIVQRNISEGLTAVVSQEASGPTTLIEDDNIHDTQQ